MATTPTSLTLTNIADGANIVASDHRNNYSAVQTAVNALITILSAGTSGQVLGSSGGTTIGWTAATTPQAVLTGVVTSAGAKTGSGFTASKTSTGTYAIVYTSAYASTPCVQVTAAPLGTNSPRTFGITAQSTTGFTVEVYGAGVITDCAFNFLVTAVV